MRRGCVNTLRSGDVRALGLTKEPLMIRFIRLIVPSLVLSLLPTQLGACEPSTETTARDASSCDEVLPTLARWTGQPIPAPSTEFNAIFLCDKPKQPQRLEAYVVDGDQIAAAFDLSTSQLGAFLAAALLPPQQVASVSTTTTTTKVVKGTTCPPKENVTGTPLPAPPAPPVAALLKSETQAMTAAQIAVYQDYTSGKSCPPPPQD